MDPVLSTMLKPFLIRDLEDNSQHPDIIEDTASDLYNATDVSVGPQRRHGLVQLAAEDYDEIAYIHPQARLTYLDEDDGETITVRASYPNKFVLRRLIVHLGRLIPRTRPAP